MFERSLTTLINPGLICFIIDISFLQVALSDCLGDNRSNRNGTLQRTAVQADSCKPFFNHNFKFLLPSESPYKRLHIEVWHRDRSSR